MKSRVSRRCNQVQEIAETPSMLKLGGELRQHLHFIAQVDCSTFYILCVPLQLCVRTSNKQETSRPMTSKWRHDDVIGRNSTAPHKGQRRGGLMFSLICACVNDWINNPDSGHFRRNRAHNDATATGTWSSFMAVLVRICECVVCSFPSSNADNGFHM